MVNHVYVLKLQNSRFYVGRSSRVEKRIKEHFDGRGSSWTQLHKPLKAIKIIEIKSNYQEDMWVKQLMNLYSIDQVRGGSYSKINLSMTQKQQLRKQIRNAEDLCFICGKSGHFAKQCRYRSSLKKETNKKSKKIYKNKKNKNKRYSEDSDGYSQSQSQQYSNQVQEQDSNDYTYEQQEYSQEEQEQSQEEQEEFQYEYSYEEYEQSHEYSHEEQEQSHEEQEEFQNEQSIQQVQSDQIQNNNQDQVQIDDSISEYQSSYLSLKSEVIQVKPFNKTYKEMTNFGKNQEQRLKLPSVKNQEKQKPSDKNTQSIWSKLFDWVSL